jgi:hypothetical protein
LACALLGSFAGLLEAIGLALDGEDLGVVDQAIDQGDDAGGVWKDLAPFGERPVGSDERAVVLVPAADELEQQVGMAIGIGEISDLVDHQKTGAGIVAQAPAQFNWRARNPARDMVVGGDYLMFAPPRSKHPPFVLNTRVFSCNLVRNDLGLRWRGRYNEDLDLSIRVLKAGWCTVLFKNLLQRKVTTQVLPGGNTEAFYQVEGTAPKSELIVKLHPDVCRLTTRYGRPHHLADFSRWKDRRLVPRADLQLPAVNPYRSRVVPRRKGSERTHWTREG